MAKIPFKVSARAGKLLGRENFSNPEGAIIELVKNSYDADANNCFVFFDVPTETKKDKEGKSYQIPIKEKSILYIIDNGEGMTEEVIKNHWMQIGTGNKEKDFVSDDDRIKTGAKGIGRFALDRLGFETEMWTLSKNAKNKSGSFWKMDWNQFDNSEKIISQIEAELEPIKIELKEKIRSLTNSNEQVENLIDKIDFHRGTIIKISNLKDDWFNEETSSVFKSLEALIPPKELNIPFEVYFNHFQQPKEFGEVKTAFFNDFDYKLKASYNAETLNVDFEIDVDGTPVEYDSPDAFTDNSQVDISIGQKLSEMSFTPNLESVVQSMMAFDDKDTIKYFSSSSIDIANLVLDKNKGIQSKGKRFPVFGQIYSDASSQLIAEQLLTFSKHLKKSKKFEPRKFIWVSPTNNAWAASTKASNFWNRIEEHSLISDGKQKQRAFTPELYLPISDKGDRRTISKWIMEFGKKESLYGLAEGFLNGNTEVVVLDGVFAYVNYHVVLADYTPLPVPIGYFTTEPKVISSIMKLVNDYVDGISSFDNPNKFGKLTEL